VDEQTEKIVKAVTTAGILGALAGGVTFLLSEEPPAKKLRTYCAGLLMALFTGYALMYTTLNEFYKTLIIGSLTAFISTIWPVLETGSKKLVSKWFSKKANDIPNSDNP
jgi:hypothetical protein